MSGKIIKGDVCSYYGQTVTLLTGQRPCAGGSCADVAWERYGKCFKGTVNYDNLVFIRRPEVSR